MKKKLTFGALVRDYDKASDFYTTKPTAAAATQAYLKSLRAAEMAEWERTGGDYMLPAFATNGFHYGIGRVCRRDAQTSGNISQRPECRIFTIAAERARL